MIGKESQGEKLRLEALDEIKLTAANRKLAEAYLDEGFLEEELPGEAEPEDFTRLSYHQRAISRYLLFLKKKKKTEELKKLVRFLAEAGGSTAYVLLIDYSWEELLDLHGMLAYLTGEHKEEQKVAILAGICSSPSVYVSDMGSLRTSCMSALLAAGKEKADVYLRALKLCYGDNLYRKDYTKMLLLSCYLHVTKPGSAPKQTKELEVLFQNRIREVFGKGNLKVHEMNLIRTYLLSPAETPFPERLLSVLRRESPGVIVKIFAGCAFLALLHSECFEMMVRLTVAMPIRFSNDNLGLNACIELTNQEWFDTQMDRIEEMLPILDEEYIGWCLKKEQYASVRRMSVKSPEGIKKLIPELGVKEYPVLLDLVKEGNPDLYQELQGSFCEMFREKAVKEIMSRLYPGREEAKQYLNGEAPFSVLLPHLIEWEDWYQDTKRYEMIQKLWEDQELELYRRAVVLEGYRYPCFFLEYYPIYEAEGLDRYQKGSYLCEERQLQELMRLMEEEKIQVSAQIEALGRICESFNEIKGKKNRTEIEVLCVELLKKKRDEWGSKRWEDGMREALVEGRNVTGCCLCLQALEQCGDQYQSIIFSCASNSKKKIRDQAVAVCRHHQDWEEPLFALFDSKTLKEREFALTVLEYWGSVSKKEQFQAVLEKEKNQKLRTRMTEFLEDLEKEGGMSNGLERTAAGILKGARKKKVEWVSSLSLPQVHDDGQNVVSPEYLLSILALYADMEVEELGRSEEAEKLAAPLCKEEFSKYMQALYQGWLLAGAEAKKRWVLYAYAFHGGSDVVSVLYQQLGKWADESRGAMAAEAVRAIAFQGSQEALLLVDQMSRKYKSRQVKNAAAAALSSAAAALKISKEELEDRIVPTFGFDDKAERTFDYGSRTFTVRLDTMLELNVYDEQQKCLKNLPAPGKRDDEETAKAAYEAFKQMKKQLKTVALSQKLRLLQALRSARLWEVEKWKDLFIKNPIMHSFAMGLIWGIYEEGSLKETFRYLEDGSFTTCEEEAYALAETGSIGLVHPLELETSVLTAWKEQLKDYEITQPIEQLWRPVYQVPEEEKGKLIFDQFYGKTFPVITLSGKLLGAGWYRGEIGDAGYFYNYYRKDGNMGAELTFSGCSVGYENPEVTVYSLYFYELDERGAFQKKNQKQLSDVTKRYFSEVVCELTALLG